MKTCDEALLARLPLPLAKLYRRAHNAKDVGERHRVALFLWEATLKLAASVTIAAYLDGEARTDELDVQLNNLSHPSFGCWWELLCRVLPVVAAQDAGYEELRDGLLGRDRQDWPQASRLDVELRAVLDGTREPTSGFRPLELIERLLRYRAREIDAGAGRSAEFHALMGEALLGGAEDLLRSVDVAAGRSLVFIDHVGREHDGRWLIDRLELRGESALRLEPVFVDESAHERLPTRTHVHLLSFAAPYPEGWRFVSVDPLLVYLLDADDLYFLNGMEASGEIQYLNYTRGLHQRLDPRRRAVGDDPVRFLRPGPERTRTWESCDTTSIEPPDRPVGVAETVAHVTVAPSAAAASRRIGEYELISELGRGNMGVVYRAKQLSLGREVALKCSLRPGDEKADARFRREIQALGRVDHPNLVKVYGSGEFDGQWYYAMELVEGASLGAVFEEFQSRSSIKGGIDLSTWQDCFGSAVHRSRRSERPLRDAAVKADPRLGVEPDDEAAAMRRQLLARRGYVRHVAELMRQVASAAHALHEARVVHRDIKPANIIVSVDGETAVLMDLGLAQLADEQEGRLTRTRQFVGSLRYASPEQVHASVDLDRRSDVYSLGATLYELLALGPIYDADDATPIPVLMARITREEPARLRTRHPGIPLDLEAIVARCLEKKPDARYASAAELAEDLQRFLEGEPIQARGITAIERGWKWIRRRPLEASLAAATLVAVIAAAGAGLENLYQRRLERDFVRSQENFRDASAALAELLKVAEDELAGDQRNKPARDNMLKVAERYYENVSARLRSDPRLRPELADAYVRLARTLIPNSPARGREMYQKAIELLAGTDQRVRTKESRRILGEALHECAVSFVDDEKDMRTAQPLFDRAIAIREKLRAEAVTAKERDEAKDALARSYGYRGDVRLGLGESDPASLDLAERDYRESHRIRAELDQAVNRRGERIVDRDRRFQLARGHENLMLLYQARRNSELASATFKEAAELFRALLELTHGNDRHPSRDECIEDQAFCERAMGRYLLSTRRLDEAKQLLSRSIDGYRQLVKRRPEMTRYALTLATTLLIDVERSLESADGSQIAERISEAATLLDRAREALPSSDEVREAMTKLQQLNDRASKPTRPGASTGVGR